MRQRQARRQRRLAAHRNIAQRLLRQIDRVRRRQHQPRLIFLEDDQAHAIAALIRIGQQRHDRALGRLHALGHRHRPRRIDDEQDQVRRLADAHFLLIVVAFDAQARGRALRPTCARF